MNNIAKLNVSYNVDTRELIINGKSYGACHKRTAMEYINDRFEREIGGIETKKVFAAALANMR